MKTKLTFFLFFSLFAFHFLLVSAQAPAWHEYAERRNLYPADRYFTGFGQIRVEKDENPEEKLKRAKSDASAEATQTIETTVQIVNYHNITELDKRIAEEFRQSVSTFSNVTVQGLKVEAWYDKKTRTSEAFAWVKKRDLAETYNKLFNVQTVQLEAKINEAKGYQSGGQSMRALETYQSCLPMVRELQKDMVMVIICGSDVTGKMPLEYQAEINAAIAALDKTPIGTLEELCQRLSNTLQKQLDNNNRTIRLTPFTYQDTKMVSQLSARLLVVMEQKLTGSGLNVSTLAGKPSDNALMLTGVYWEEENSLSFTVNVRDPATGKTLASAVNSLPLSWLTKNGFSWKPENLEDALIRQKVMTKDELIGGGLLLDIWTNKGNENLLFTEGETMKLSVRANHECYLRFIYYFADSTKTLLEDGYYISNDQVNKVVTLPSDYICLPPFGAEILQVIAQNEPFKPLQWRMQDGYKIILGNTDGIVANSRAFQKKTNQQLFAEKRLIITTIKK